jgi:hypothetical protein
VVLGETLRFTVPFHIAEVRDRPVAWLVGEAKRAATILATHGDDMQFGGKHSGEAFNALARGLACAALVADGGVTYAGLHWCRDPLCRDPAADHPVDVDAVYSSRPVEDVAVGGGLP